MAFVLIGFMGAGKSTVARELAAETGTEALDSDVLLEERLGHSVAREFELSGEEAFRAKEETLVCELLDGAAPEAVIALGGGSVLSARVRGALAGHTTILLEIDAHTAWERVRGEPGGEQRPLARDRESFRALHAVRAGLYEQIFDAVLPDLPRGHAVRALDALRSLGRAP
jgi:shikimate kinase/3-dehydroquinate synthase